MINFTTVNIVTIIELNLLNIFFQIHDNTISYHVAS